MVTAALLKIGEIARQTGVSVGTLRYYESLHLLHPAERGDNGYRYYQPAMMEQVKFIKQAQVLGFSLDEIRRILDVRDHGEQPCDLVQELLQSKIAQFEAQIQQMMAFKAELEGYRDRWSAAATPGNAPTSNIAVCPLIATVPM